MAGMRILLLVLGLSMGMVALGSDKTVVVGTLGDYAPLGFFADGTRITLRETIPPGEDSEAFVGYSWDVLRESFHAQGYTVELEIAPWTRSMANLRSGRLDVLFPTSKTEDRLQYMVYSERPVNEVRFRVYVPRDAELDWRGLDSLAGMRIGAMRGWNYGDEWRAASGFEKYPLSGIEQGFNMLEAGRLDGFAGYEIHWDYALHRMGQADQYRKLPVFGSKKEFVTALKENPRGSEFLDAFDAGKRHLKETGRLDEIARKWE